MDDGYFSMDIYLREYDVAVEFDGPTHYYHNSTDSSSSSRDASMTRNAKTELRDLFLAKQCAKVVTVPWFEWHHLGTRRRRKGCTCSRRYLRSWRRGLLSRLEV
jgi:hypothetical protein